MKHYFCENPKCKTHILVDVTTNHIKLHADQTELVTCLYTDENKFPKRYQYYDEKVLEKELFITKQGKRLFFCAICAAAINKARGQGGQR